MQRPVLNCNRLESCPSPAVGENLPPGPCVDDLEILRAAGVRHGDHQVLPFFANQVVAVGFQQYTVRQRCAAASRTLRSAGDRNDSGVTRIGSLCVCLPDHEVRVVRAFDFTDWVVDRFSRDMLDGHGIEIRSDILKVQIVVAALYYYLSGDARFLIVFSPATVDFYIYKT